MKRLLFLYNTFILAFLFSAGWIAYNADERDYRNVFYLFTSLGLIAIGYLFSDRFTERAEDKTAGRGGGVITPLLIVALGAGLRFYGLSFGLPHNYHPDEIPKVNAVMRMYDQGTLDPNYFLHPSLLLYSTYFFNYLFHLAGAEGTFRETAFLAGRTVSALAGSLSVLIVFYITKEIFKKEAALMAAFLLAVFPLHVTCSRYLKEDSLLVFFILLTLLSTLIALRKDNFKILFISAFFAGLSASTKYSGVLSFAIIAATPWLKSDSIKPDVRYLKAVFVCGLISVFGFLIATPYSVLNSARFIKDVSYESGHMSEGHTTAVDAWSQYWMYHISRSIVPGVGFLTLAFALLKSGAIVNKKRPKELLIFALLLLFYMSAEYVKSKPAPQPERYILPCLPFIAILAAGIFEDLFRSGKKNALIIVLLITVCFFPLKRSFELASELKYDTRIQLSDWIDKNIPEGSKIMTDRLSYGPLLNDKKYQVLNLNGSEILQDLDVKNLRKSGFDYLILSSLFYGRYFSEPKVEPVARQRIRELSKYFQVVNKIEPRYGTYGFHNPELILYSLKSPNAG
jgi:hypothetical protein